MKTVFIGSVMSSKVALETIIKNEIKIDLVCSLDENASGNVSDYFPIHEVAIANNIEYIKFEKIQSKNVFEKIKNLRPDFLFVIGLSQIIPNQILDLVNYYSIGFHPTKLPKFRGRAAIPWQILLNVKQSEVSLFKIDEGMDSGDIIFQYPYYIESTDYANDVYTKVCDAMIASLEKCLKDIYSGTVDFKKQNEKEATYLLTRRPADGLINWFDTAKNIFALIRSTSKPYPGAFTFYRGNKVIIWRAEVYPNNKYIGFPGQIAYITEKGIGVLTIDNILHIQIYETDNNKINFKVGHKFN